MKIIRRRGQLTRTDPGEARLWHIRWALLAGGSAAVLGLAALWFVAWTLLGFPRVSHSGKVGLHDAVSVVQLVFASVAGAGALVALIVAYRRQKVAEADSARDRTRVFNERFATIATQLGDTNPAVRLAGVHAMAGLADDWKPNRQTCVDVLCAYLRLPYNPEPVRETPPPQRSADEETGAEEPAELSREFLVNREVRNTVIRLIGAHLRDGGAVSWQGLNLDFTGVVFDGDLEFAGATFSGGNVSFDEATFSGANVSFDRTSFSGANVSFKRARFSGGTVIFGAAATFCGGNVSFDGARFSGGTVIFGATTFSGGTVGFDGARFSRGNVIFGGARFSGGSKVTFDGATFSGGNVTFGGARFSGGSKVTFYGATFSAGSNVTFDRATFSGGTVTFGEARFSGGNVTFGEARFSGGQVQFLAVKDWSVPPTGLDMQPRPEGLILPGDQAPDELDAAG